MADTNDNTTDPAGATPTTTDNTALTNALAAERKRATDAENQLKQLRVQMAAQAQAGDASKTEMQKLTERMAAAEDRAAKAERAALIADIARDKKLPKSLAKRLTGETAEELAADADELLAAFAPAGNDGDAGDQGTGDNSAGQPPAPAAPAANTTSTARPKERLVDGAAPGGGHNDETDMKAIADDILR